MLQQKSISHYKIASIGYVEKKVKELLKNETPKIIWDFELQTDHLIQARRPNLVPINKKRELAI